MTVYELVEKLGGEIVRGKARIRQGQEYVVIGYLNGDNMDFTEAGRLLAAETEPKQEEAPKRVRRVKEAAPVEEKIDIEDNIKIDLD